MKKNDSYTWWEKIILVAAIALLVWRDFFPFQPSTIEDMTIMTSDGYFVVTIQDTGSMSPLIRAGGAKAIVHQVKTIDEFKPGNIVVYYPDYKKGGVMHRLIEKNGQTLAFKGDSGGSIDLIDFNNASQIYKVHSLISI